MENKAAALITIISFIIMGFIVYKKWRSTSNASHSNSNSGSGSDRKGEDDNTEILNQK